MSSLTRQSNQNITIALASKSRQGRLTAKWLVVDGKLVCKWIVVA